MDYIEIISWLWLALGAVWLFNYFRTKKTMRRPLAGKYLATTGLIVVGFSLLFAELPGFLSTAATPRNDFFGIMGLFLTVAGVAFAIWARITLGRNWSGSVATVKEGHELVRSGPYALVRHPIYTGLFFGMLGTAFAFGSVGSYLGVLVGLAAYLFRIRMEEGIMTAEFGGAYTLYKEQVKALIPFVW